MKNKLINKTIDYTGKQLRSDFIENNFHINGEAMISFIGKCDVNEHMVDLEDKRKKEFIYSEKMLHFIIRHSDKDLEKTVLRKRLLISIMLEELHKILGHVRFYRDGNGIYDKKGRKLTVSVATFSPTCNLIHAGLNISSKNTPIKTSCLKDVPINPKKFAKMVMDRYCCEMDSVKHSATKVKGVK